MNGVVWCPLAQSHVGRSHVNRLLRARHLTSNELPSVCRDANRVRRPRHCIHCANIPSALRPGRVERNDQGVDCRLSTNHAKLSAHFGMHWRWRPRPQPSGPAQLQRRSQSTFTSKSFTSTLTASTVQVGCGTTLCPGSAALFLPTAYGLSVVCHYSPQARSQMGARLVPCAPVCFCTSMRPEPCCSASLSVWDGRFRTPPRSAPCHV